MTTGNKIALLRKDRGLSQIEFAEAIGVSRQSVSKWEAGEATPDTDKILAISRFFDVTTDWLLKEDAEDVSSLRTAEEKAASASEALRAAAAGSDESTENAHGEESVNERKHSNAKNRRKLLYALLVVFIAVFIGALVFLLKDSKGFRLFSSKEKEPVRRPYVLVHGLGGWGEGSGMQSVSPYWGAQTGDLAVYLREQGWEVYTPSVGPLSSAWDRCCELYAVLTGSTVDYGAAHAAAHHHNRYGRAYASPLIPGWGDTVPQINLVGHSFGGETVRLLASLLAYGAPEEVEAAGDSVSPLFTGGKGGYIHSVTTLCSPHNGSSLTCVLDSLGGIAGVGDTTELLASLCFAGAGIANPVNGVYDFMLDQFGISEINGGFTEISSVLHGFFAAGTDHAGYDLSPDGAAELNGKIRLAEGVYYFSYSYSTTEAGSLLPVQVPSADTLPVLSPFALAMGAYNGKTPGGILIGADWQENDGLVSVISAKAPFGDPQMPLPETYEADAAEAQTAADSDADKPAEAQPEPLEPGLWYVAKTRHGHHGTVIGMDGDAGSIHAFYMKLFAMIDKL